jgi:hypothetical protein
MSFIIKSLVSQLPGLIEGSLQTIEDLIGPQLTVLKQQHADHAAKFLENWRALNTFIEEKLQGISTAVKATYATYKPQFLHAPAPAPAQSSQLVPIGEEHNPFGSTDPLGNFVAKPLPPAPPALPTAQPAPPANSSFSSLLSSLTGTASNLANSAKQKINTARQQLAKKGGKKRKGSNKKRTRRGQIRK